MAVIAGNVEFYAGPHTVGAPDNLEDTIVDFIDAATKRLYVAVQELENQRIAEALIRARQRKVLVKLVLEQAYLKAASSSPTPFKAGGKHEANRTIHSAILRANVDVKCDYNTHIFHQKFIVRDGESVLTGSTNFTPTGTANNLNHVVIIHDEDIAKIYGREFREIQRGRFGKFSEGHDVAPKRQVVSGVSVKVLFAPDHSPEMEIMKQMLKAKSRVDFAIFTFSKSSGIDDTLLALLRLGIEVNGALDARQGAQEWAPTEELVANGANLFRVGSSGGVRKLHHKLMVIDDQVVIAGSFNYTGPANRLNDENIVVLGDLNASDPAQIAAQKRIALFAREEIDRIKREHGRRF